jgi:hypothetical protein
MRKIFIVFLIALSSYMYAQDNIVTGNISIPEKDIQLGSKTEISIILKIKGSVR